MKDRNPILFIGALLGLTAVALGAYFEHGLKARIEPESFGSLQIALRHQQLHSVVIVAIGISLLCDLSSLAGTWLKRAAASMILGIVIFSGSIYLTYIFDLVEFRRMAPTGGVLTMLGWLLLAYVGVAKAKTPSH